MSEKRPAFHDCVKIMILKLAKVWESRANKVIPTI